MIYFLIKCIVRLTCICWYLMWIKDGVTTTQWNLPRYKEVRTDLYERHNVFTRAVCERKLPCEQLQSGVRSMMLLSTRCHCEHSSAMSDMYYTNRTGGQAVKC